MSIIYLILCFFTIFLLVECKDGNINVYLEKSNVAACNTKNLTNYSFVENDHVSILVIHQTFFNYAWIDLPKMSIHYDPHKQVLEFSLHKSMDGEWEFVFLHLLSTTSTKESNFQYIDNKYYARTTCTIHVKIEADTLSPLIWLALLTVSGFTIILLIVLIIIVIYFKRKGRSAIHFKNLAKRTTQNLDPDRYSTHPRHKKSMKLVEPIEEDRDSCIYENPETCLSGLGPLQMQLPPNVPNTPRPVHQAMFKTDPGIHSTATLKLSAGQASYSQHPTLARTHSLQDGDQSAQKTSRQNFVSSTLAHNSSQRNQNPQHTFPRQNHKQNGKSEALPPLPLQNEETYEEMDSYEPEIYEELPESDSPQMKRTSRAKIPGAILVSNPPEFRKPNKPPVSEKPKRITAGNAAQQNVKGTTSMRLPSVQPNKPTPAAFRPKAATTSTSSRPNFQAAHQTIAEELSRVQPNAGSQHPIPAYQPNPVAIPVTEAIYNNEERNSSDDEWFYEELKPDRYYRD